MFPRLFTAVFQRWFPAAFLGVFTTTFQWVALWFRTPSSISTTSVSSLVDDATAETVYLQELSDAEARYGP
ncbi:uncharacterized protein BDZ99DRAFT_468525 [Mytilinidion resinicola]|uniref:Uncharacterized protein n=1 Tax=Mytilinidion resinicola TaxID=574789 RepID=A0A6A6Y2Z6_9PEZI|nr:uncharacterized protein BDZ99DRAFT_468525 [Mytilinidion resinicola]KAF2803191.1 hypothetical protein BDZ99DRAFT_468525 [Mytilinidion resinicola]